MGTFDICPVLLLGGRRRAVPRTRRTGGGANKLSLDEARANFRALGVSDPRFKENVRAPLPEEEP